MLNHAHLSDTLPIAMYIIMQARNYTIKYPIYKAIRAINAETSKNTSKNKSIVAFWHYKKVCPRRGEGEE